MNFGKSPSDAIIRQQPTYHLPSNFTTRPFPNGPLELGTVVDDIKLFTALNQGDDRVAIPEGEKYSGSKEGIKASVSKSTSAEIGILARVLHGSIGGDADLKGKRNDEDEYNIERLETLYFLPRPSYLSECMKLADVQDYLKGSNCKEPVYLITGLKIAWGATITMVRGRDVEAGGSIGGKAPAGPVELTLDTHARATGNSEMTTTNTKPADFVVGIQVLKLQYERKPFSKEQTLRKKLVAKGAVLVDDDESVDESSDDVDKNFIVIPLNDEDMEGMRREDVDGATWILPSEL
jgi:hypothetical protein